nr:hypothetical protein [Tanacetum cinerariifolium]
SKDVHQEHCHQEASGRPLTGSGKLPEEMIQAIEKNAKDKEDHEKFEKFLWWTIV